MRTLSDAPVAVTGVEVGREGDGVSYLSIGYPGATVQVLQKLDAGNIAEDIRRLAPDVIVLAFGTNEGFNDNLDVNAYISQYEQIVRRLQALRPGLKIVIIGPADAARPAGQCHAEGVGQHCASNAGVQTAVDGILEQMPLPDAAEAQPGARSAAQARRPDRSGVLGLVDRPGAASAARKSGRRPIRR